MAPTPGGATPAAKDAVSILDPSQITANDLELRQLRQFQKKLRRMPPLNAEFAVIFESMQRRLKENEDLATLVESQKIEISSLKTESARKDEEIARLTMLIKPPVAAKVKEVDKRSDPGPMKLRKVQEGGPAALQGIQRGDQLIFVNGVNVEGQSHQEIGELMGGGKEKNERVKLVVRHNPERLWDVEEDWNE